MTRYFSFRVISDFFSNKLWLVQIPWRGDVQSPLASINKDIAYNGLPFVTTTMPNLSLFVFSTTDISWNSTTQHTIKLIILKFWAFHYFLKHLKTIITKFNDCCLDRQILLRFENNSTGSAKQSLEWNARQ